MSWLWPLAAGLAVSAGALVGSAAILLLRDVAEEVVAWLLAFAIGTLLGAASRRPPQGGAPPSSRACPRGARGMRVAG